MDCTARPRCLRCAKSTWMHVVTFGNEKGPWRDALGWNRRTTDFGRPCPGPFRCADASTARRAEIQCATPQRQTSACEAKSSGSRAKSLVGRVRSINRRAKSSTRRAKSSTRGAN